MTKKELAELILELGVSQKTFADALGVNPSTVNRWLSGEIPISPIAAAAIQFLVDREKGGIACLKES